MPTPRPDEEQPDFIKRCIPIVIDEGTAEDGVQASAICHSIWKKSKEEHTNNTLPIEVMSIGVWNQTKFTLEHLHEMAKNFQALKDTVKPPIKLGHTQDKPGAPAYGWIEDLKVVGEKLVAYVRDIPKLLMDAIKAKRYRRVSSEVYFDYTYKGKKYGRVFSALALLGADIPAVSDLEDLQAYLMSQNSDKGSFGTLMAFTAPVDLNIDALDDDKESKMDLKEMEAQMKSFSDQLAKLTEENANLKTVNAQLEKEKDEAAKAVFEEKKIQASNDFKAYCEQQVKDGKLLPAQRDILVGKECFSETGTISFSVDQLKAVIDLSDKILDTKQYSQEDSKETKLFDNVQIEIDQKINDYMITNKVEYAEAMRQVLIADKDLANRYTKDRISA